MSSTHKESDICHAGGATGKDVDKTREAIYRGGKTCESEDPGLSPAGLFVCLPDRNQNRFPTLTPAIHLGGSLHGGNVEGKGGRSVPFTVNQVTLSFQCQFTIDTTCASDMGSGVGGRGVWRRVVICCKIGLYPTIR